MPRSLIWCPKGRQDPVGSNNKVCCYYCWKWQRAQTQPWRTPRNGESLWRGKGWVTVHVWSQPWSQFSFLTFQIALWCCPALPNKKQRLTVVLVLATLIAAFGSSFQYGYNVSVVNSPSQVSWLKKEKLEWNSLGRSFVPISALLLFSVHAAVL